MTALRKRRVFQDNTYRSKLFEEAIKPRPLLSKDEIKLVGKATIESHAGHVANKDAQFWKGVKAKMRKLGPHVKNMHGCLAYLAPCATLDEDEINEANQKWRLKFTADPHRASVFIVSECSKAKMAMVIRVSLIGGCLMSKQAFQTYGEKGVILKHDAFLKAKKTWFISQGFRDENPKLFNAIQHCFGYDVCLKSKLADVDKKDVLVARAKRRSAAGYGT